MSKSDEDTTQQDNNQDKDNQEEQASGRTIAEWVTFAVAALILAGVIAVIGADAVDTRRPPVFTTTVATTTERNGAHYITVEVHNEGDTTASDVKVNAQLRQNGSTVEQATQTLGFLAGQERRLLTFVFAHDPRQAQLQTGVSAFQVP
ncbi:hypothetical protein ACT4S5_07915 [Kocuria oceani]|uniref:hypothetical protein n=1 Tax=Kocuria oceani TaxID=988827 RepID=UPI004036098D